MTLEDVQQAKEAVEAAGRYASIEAVRGEMGYGSRRDVARFLNALGPRQPPPKATPAPQAVADEDPVHHGQALPVVDVTPVAPDPVARAEAAVLAAERNLDVARDNLDQAVLAVWLSRGIVLDGIRYGGYADGDPAKAAVVEQARVSMGDYRECWQALVAAREALTQLDRLHRRQKQEAYVRAHQPQLPATLDHWAEKLRTAPSDRLHAEAKKNHAEAMHAWQQAVAHAPWASNGVSH